MRTGSFKYILLGCLAALPARAPAAEDVYKKMAADFARYSADKKVRNIAVVGFSRRAKASREESEYVSEKLLSCLVASGKVTLLERGQLDKVLEERRLAESGLADEPAGEKKRMGASDAIIAGTIFGTPEKLNIIAKMIDPVTGRVLHTVEAETDRLWQVLSDSRGFEFEMPDIETLALMFREQEIKPEFVDWRDAPASLNTATCNSRRERLAKLQAPALEAKAKYWALRMKQPDYRPEKLQRNPGAEIIDKDARQAFYGLLERLHALAEPPQLSGEEVTLIVTLAAEEKKVEDDCGLR